MSHCARARELFGPYWDDETSRAERDWLDAHFATCERCRVEYEALARTLSALSTLPREEASPDLAERALAAARRASPARDVVFVRATPLWSPLAVAAAAVLLTLAGLAPFLLRPQGGGLVAGRGATHGLTVAAPVSPTPASPAGAPAAVAPSGTVAAVVDSLFDHSEDVDFVLDPVTLRRGRAHTTSHLPKGVQGGQALISF